MTINELEGMPILSIRESPMNGVAGVMKRALDIAGALSGIIIFSPLMLAKNEAIHLPEIDRRAGQ